MRKPTAALIWIARNPWCLAFAWLIVAALLPLVPIDETRYLTVAWEMRRSGDLVGLTLNGQPYMDKSPLMFWLINASWWVFGVSDLAARLVDVLFAAGSVALVVRVARRLGLAQPERAGWFLLPFVVFGAFAAVVMFDLALCAFFLLALDALLLWLHTRRWQGAALAWLAVAGGLLAKGPVFLVHLAAPLLLVRWWYGRPIERPWRFACGWVAVILLGLLPLAWWAWSAASRIPGVPPEQTLLHQAFGRVAGSFAHRRGPFWYLPLLPVLLLPWMLWLRWRMVPRAIRAAMALPAARLGIAASVPALVMFSAISGKQIHYLLPLLPGVSIGLAALFAVEPALLSTARTRWVALLLLVGWLWPLAHWMRGSWPFAAWQAVVLAFGLALGAAAWAAGTRTPRLASPDGRLAGTATASLCLAISLVLLVTAPLKPHLDGRPIARAVQDLLARGVPVGVLPDEPGMIGYLARLPRPLPVVRDPADWARRHPNGFVLVHASHGRLPPQAQPAVDLIDGWEGLLPAAALAAGSIDP